MIKGEPRKPLKVGSVQTIDVQTGEVVEEKSNAYTMLPPRPDVCQECAVDHPWDQPHNRDSLYYQMTFFAMHGRYPTWTDSMAHCSEGIKAMWRIGLVARYRELGRDVPDDLMDQKQSGR